MAWLRMDDNYPRNRKVVALGRGVQAKDARILHVDLLCAAAREETDGFLDGPLVDRTAAEAGVSPARLTKLVDVGLVHTPGHSCERCPSVPEGRWYLHDFLDLNPSAAERRAKRETNKARQDRWRESRNASHNGVTNASTDGVTDGVTDAPHPYPLSPSVVTSSSSLTSVGRPDDEEDFAAVVARRRLAKNREHVAVPEHWLRTVARNVRAEYAHEAAEWTGTQLELADLVEPEPSPSVPFDCPTCDNHGVYETAVGFVKCTHAVRTATGG